MSDFYVDHGAYASALGTTPTWGVPQEGDGSSKDAATAASIGSVLFGSVSTSGTISVCGVSISTTGVLSAGSVDAAANALASNINATTTPVAAGVAAGLPQLRNLVFARGPSGGAPAGTCEIMMRVGSATLNNASNPSNIVIAQTLSPAATLTQFIGGTGGCWGWLVNSAAIGVSSSIAAWTYGLLHKKPMVWTATPTQADTTWVRSGDDPVITYSATQLDLRRSELWPIHLVIDTNTKWTGDPATGTVTLNLTQTSASEGWLWSVTYSSGGDVSAYESSLVALRKHALVFNLISTVSGGKARVAEASSARWQNFRVAGALYADASTGSNSLQLVSNTIGTGGGTFDMGTAHFVDCTFRRVNPLADIIPLRITGAVSNTHMRSFSFVGCSFECNVSGATAQSLIDFSTVASTNPIDTIFSFEQCRISGWSAGGDKFALTNAAANPPLKYRVIARDFDGITFNSAYTGYAYGTTGWLQIDTSALTLHNPRNGGPFRHENITGVSEFNPEASPAQPTYAATQADGTKWSLRSAWLNTAGVVRRTVGFSPPILRATYLGASGVKTVKIRLFMRSAFMASLTPGDMHAVISYVNSSTGAMVSESIRAVPASSAAVWDGAAGHPTFEAREFSLTTSGPVLSGSEVAAKLTFYGAPRSGQSESVYIDPELGVA